MLQKNARDVFACHNFRPSRRMWNSFALNAGDGEHGSVLLGSKSAAAGFCELPER